MLQPSFPPHLRLSCLIVTLLEKQRARAWHAILLFLSADHLFSFFSDLLILAKHSFTCLVLPLRSFFLIFSTLFFCFFFYQNFPVATRSTTWLVLISLRKLKTNLNSVDNFRNCFVKKLCLSPGMSSNWPNVSHTMMPVYIILWFSFFFKPSPRRTLCSLLCFHMPTFFNERKVCANEAKLWRPRLRFFYRLLRYIVYMGINTTCMRAAPSLRLIHFFARAVKICILLVEKKFKSPRRLALTFAIASA